MTGKAILCPSRRSSARQDEKNVLILQTIQLSTCPQTLKVARLLKPLRVLERCFRLLLKHAVENYPAPLSVTYVTTAEYSSKSENFHSLVAPRSTTSRYDMKTSLNPKTDSPHSPHTPNILQSTTQREVTLRIISPTFYSRFFHYRTPNEAFENELLDDERTRTIWSSDPALFASIFPRELLSGAEPTKFLIGSNKYHRRMLSALRKAPVSTNFPRTVPYVPFRGISDMDKWIIKNCSPQHGREYRRALLRVFIGEWFGGTFGPWRGLRTVWNLSV